MLASIAMMAAVTVSSKQQLDAAIARARGGEVINLAKANYGVITIQDRVFTAPLNIRSANRATPAVFEGLRMRKVRNVTFSDIEVTRVRGADPDWAKMVTIEYSANISFIGGFVHGPTNGTWQDNMNGMYVRNTDKLRVSGLAFHDLRVALVIDDGTNFNIENNVFSFLSLDAMNIPGARGGRIFNNLMFEFRVAPGGHPDGIQCWTAGKTVGCQNVVISKNRFIGTPGHEFQGIFFGDEAKVGGYNGIQIISNTFSNTYWHAINITGTGSGVVVNNNTVTAGPNMRPWIRVDAPITILGNSAPTYVIAGKEGVPAGNRLGGVYIP